MNSVAVPPRLLAGFWRRAFTPGYESVSHFSLCNDKYTEGEREIEPSSFLLFVPPWLDDPDISASIDYPHEDFAPERESDGRRRLTLLRTKFVLGNPRRSVQLTQLAGYRTKTDGR